MVRIVVACLLASCAYDARFADCEVSCAADAGCPDDFTCSNEGLCRAPGQTQTCRAILGDAGTDAPSAPASCVGLAKTCGPIGTEDCCSTATPIPGGAFYRSYDTAADGMFPDTSYPATVNPFVLDRFEVTVGRFRKFVEAGMGTQARPPTNGAGARTLNATANQGGWDPAWNTNLVSDTAALITAVKCDAAHQSWTDTPSANESLPMNCVSWYEAFAFCAWDGGFLPTESEWNFAAAGGDEQRAYPWSNPTGSTTIDCTIANYAGCGDVVDRVGSESPNGDGRWGQADLAGDVWEWGLDWYASPYPSAACDDCANLTGGSLRVNRGGGYSFASSYLRSAFRGYEDPAPHYASLGVRCARSVQ